MKKVCLLLAIVWLALETNAQKLDDFGRIVINPYLPENLEIPSGAARLLSTKLDQLTTQSGLGGSEVNPRFVITPQINIGTKDIIAGPPQMIAQNIELTLIIGDAVNNIKFASATLNIKGVGTNETKAFIQAFKTINPRNKELADLIENGKKKIIEYYRTQCDFILKDAQALVNQSKHDEAIYKLSLVPEVCQECYYKCLDTLSSIYQQKIDADCQQKMTQAKAAWAGKLNSAGAEEAAEIIATINPQANCQDEIRALTTQINNKLSADAKARWDFKMKQYDDKVAQVKEETRIAEEKSIRDDDFREVQAQRDDQYRNKQADRNFELDKMKVTAYREVAVEYARNQPKSITYNKTLF